MADVRGAVDTKNEHKETDGETARERREGER